MLKVNRSPLKIFSPRLVVFRAKHRLNHPGVYVPQSVQYKTAFNFPDEYADRPIYPEIRPKHPPGSWGSMEPKKAWMHFELGEKHYRHLKSVEERLTVMAYQNMMCRFDKVDVEQINSKLIWMLNGRPRSPRSLPFYKYITRTHVTDELPKFYKTIDVESLLNFVKPILIDRILTGEFAQKRDKSIDEEIERNEYKVSSIVNEKNLRANEEKSVDILNTIVRTIVNVLSEHKNYLRKSRLGSNVPIESWWSFNLNGLKLDRAKWHHDQNTTSFQFRDKAAVQIKTERPLKTIVDPNSSLCQTPVPICPFAPSAFKVFTDRYLPMQIPGHWRGESHDFNLLTIYPMDRLFSHESFFGDDEIQQSVMSWLVNAGHAELLAQAYYLGFSMWREPSYPLICQTILSDRRRWVFGVYQLNTMGHFKPDDGQTTSNLCWVSPMMNLYDRIENGEIVNFNDEVLRQLLRFIVNEPVENPSWNLRPYVEDLTNLDDRYKKFIRNLYEVVKLEKQDSREHHRWAKIHHGTTVFNRRYAMMTTLFKDIVFDNWPREWFGRTLEKIERKKTSATFKDYDLLLNVKH